MSDVRCQRSGVRLAQPEAGCQRSGVRGQACPAGGGVSEVRCQRSEVSRTLRRMPGSKCEQLAQQ